MVGVAVIISKKGKKEGKIKIKYYSKNTTMKNNKILRKYYKMMKNHR